MCSNVTIMNITEKKNNCYVVLKDSAGNSHYFYGVLSEEGPTHRSVYIHGIPTPFPKEDVVVYGDIV